MIKKALIITSRYVQDHEFIYPFYRLKEEGYEVHTFNCEKKQTIGYFGTKIPPKEEDRIVNINQIQVKDYDVLILPGGVKSMEILRLKKEIIEIIKSFNSKNKIIAATCSAVMMLISSGLTNKKNITGYYAWKVDIENSGAKFIDKPCVVDGNLVTSPHYKYLGEWMAGTLNLLNKKKQY